MALPLIPLFFLGGGAALIVWGVRQRTRLAATPTGWVSVMGTVVRVAGGPARIDYLTPGGRRLRLQAPDASYEDGDGVEVLVDPADPTRARLASQDREIASLSRQFIVLGVVSVLIGVPALIAFA